MSLKRQYPKWASWLNQLSYFWRIQNEVTVNFYNLYSEGKDEFGDKTCSDSDMMTTIAFAKIYKLLI